MTTSYCDCAETCDRARDTMTAIATSTASEPESPIVTGNYTCDSTCAWDCGRAYATATTAVTVGVEVTVNFTVTVIVAGTETMHIAKKKTDDRGEDKCKKHCGALSWNATLTDQLLRTGR